MGTPGRSGIPLMFTDEVTSTGSATALYPLGALRIEVNSTAAEGNCTYRYVKFDNGSGNVAAAAGACCYAISTTATKQWDVTSDVSTTDSGLAKGVFQSILTDAYYGWIKTKGYQSNVKKATGSGHAWVKGDYLHSLGAATDDGRISRIKLAATTKATGAELRALLERHCGYAAAAVSSTTATGGAYLEME